MNTTKINSEIEKTLHSMDSETYSFDLSVLDNLKNIDLSAQKQVEQAGRISGALVPAILTIIILLNIITVYFIVANDNQLVNSQLIESLQRDILLDSHDNNL